MCLLLPIINLLTIRYFYFTLLYNCIDILNYTHTGVSWARFLQYCRLRLERNVSSITFWTSYQRLVLVVVVLVCEGEALVTAPVSGSANHSPVFSPLTNHSPASHLWRTDAVLTPGAWPGARSTDLSCLWPVHLYLPVAVAVFEWRIKTFTQMTPARRVTLTSNINI